MNVLYLTYDGLLDPLGQSQILPYLYGLAQRLGVAFDIVSFEKAERRSHEAALRQELLRFEIRWHPLSFTRKPPILSKAYDAWRFFWAAEQVVRTRPIDFLHARSYVGGWVAHRISQRYGKPWLFDMRGFWADERRETRAWPPGHLFYEQLYAIWKKRERIMLRSASHVIVLTQAAKTFLIQAGIPAEKISIIPCVADYDHFQPYFAQRTLYRQRLNLPPDAYVLGYLGSIGALYEVKEMLRFFQVLQRLRADTYMVFFTPASAETVYAYADAVGVPRERLRVSFIPRAEVPLWCSVMDTSIIFCRPGFSRIGSFPTRVAEVLAMNIPIVMQADLGDNRLLAQQVEGIYLCESFTTQAYERVAQLLLDAQHQNGLSSPRHTSQALLSLPIGLSRYEQVYKQLKLAPQRLA
ncbi:MAG: glycosyltransferase [Bacteroidia bacterium]|nr:glycosyltransferase [Bacteroidia bacterium]